MKYYFGIINYNGDQVLAQCLKSLLAILGDDDEVWVLDNCSTDNSFSENEKAFSHRVRFNRAQSNLGYAGGINWFCEHWGDGIWVFANMDLIFDSHWKIEMDKSISENAKASAFASLVLEQTEPRVINSSGVNFYKDFHPQSIGSGVEYTGNENFNNEIFGPYGALMTFKSELFTKIKFDESYFLFFEETDFFMRFNLLGEKLIFASKAIVNHYRSWSTKRYSLNKLYYSERNRWTSVFKLAPLYYWPIACFYTVRRLYCLATNKKSKAASVGAELPSKFFIVKTLVSAFLAALFRLPTTLKKRKAFFKLAKIRPNATLILLEKFSLESKDLSLR